MKAMEMNGKATIVISPYRAANGRSIGAHVERAEALCLLLARAGVPTFASHLYATAFLNDADPVEREAGIAISKCWIARADRLAVWDPWGISSGMGAEIAWAEEINAERRAAGEKPTFTLFIREPIQIHYFTSAEVPEWNGTFTRDGRFR
jgi:hypothetical protein